MNKTVRALGVSVLSIFAVCASPRPPAAQPAGAPDSNLVQTFQKHSALPIVFIDQDAIDAAMRAVPAGILGVTADFVLPDVVRKKSGGIEPTHMLLKSLLASYYGQDPGTYYNQDIRDDGRPTTANLCVIYADLPGKGDKGALTALTKIEADSFSSVVSGIDPEKLNIPIDVARRFVQLHEGFHCTDTRYVPLLRATPALVTPDTDSAFSQSSDFRLRMDYIRYKSEVFADTAALLKMAQEGHEAYIPAYIATRAMGQIYRFHTQMENPVFASHSAYDSAGVFVGRETGWPDNLGYIAAPSLTYYTLNGLNAVRKMVSGMPQQDLRAMTMDEVIETAYAITERTTPDPDTFRALSYALWSAPRATYGEPDQATREALCPAPCYTAIGMAEKIRSDMLANAYFTTISAAMAPFRANDPAPH